MPHNPTPATAGDTNPTPLWPFVPRTEREYWLDIVNALNSAVAAGMPLGIDLDGTITDHSAWSIAWDREAGRWALAGYDEDSHDKSVAEYLSTPYTDDFSQTPAATIESAVRFPDGSMWLMPAGWRRDQAISSGATLVTRTVTDWTEVTA